jgi:hypothetical protein
MTTAETGDRPQPDETNGSQQSQQATADETPATQDDTETGARVPLLDADELQAVVTRWREIQTQFVDEPRHAVQDADALVSDLMDRLSRTFAEERRQLESRWSGAESISTEDLRQGLQRYRSFFERLLAA